MGPAVVEAQSQNNRSERPFWREFLSVISVLIAAFLLAFVLITYVFQTYQVDGSSMQSTLYNNDRLIVWKVARTWGRITGHQYIPKRGDIIIFTENLTNYGQVGYKQLVKRVVGLPGDTVVINNGYVTIYNSAHPKGFDPDKTLPYSKSIKIPYTVGDMTYKLRSNQLFVMGDNRPVSEDSRSFGPINANQIIGQLVLRAWPFSKAQIF